MKTLQHERIKKERHNRVRYLKHTIYLSLLLSLLFLGSSTEAQIDFLDVDNQVSSLEEELVNVTSMISSSSLQKGETYRAAVVVDIKPDWHINSTTPYEDWLIPANLSIDTVDGITPHDIVFPEGHDEFLGEDKMSVYSGRTVVFFKIDVDDNISDGEYNLPLNFSYQPCNNKECRAPGTIDTTLSITVGVEGEPIHADIFSDDADNGEPQEASTSANEENDLQDLVNKYGIWGYFLALGLAFITGLLLSFSPCTYPMIPITVSVFAGQKRSVGRGFFLSLLYVGSMATVYGIMGLVVALVGGVFGAWLASTPVVIGIAVVFVIFSLSMFGLYELQVPSSLRQKMGTGASGGGIMGSIILGVVAALVVSPCVGPFVAGILLYIATSGSPLIGFLVLFVFALGLGTLYVIIATFSSAVNALPGSGGWMDSVKKFFGFVLLLMAIYFLRTIVSPTVTAVITGLILIAFGVFGGGLDRLTGESGFFMRLKKFLGILALLIGGYLLAGTIISQGFILPPAMQWLSGNGTTGQEIETGLIDWEHDLETGLERGLKEGKPILVDTWATWCANCRVLDKKTFGNPDVAKEAERFVSVKVQLEKSGSDMTKSFMKRFGMKQYSLPTTLLLDSRGNVKKIFQGVVEPDDIIAEMKKLK
ncbi:MAG: hypothetical protein DRP47_10930 [Candidatus Zixiibacteriota bacterium]|nr:MAG: hypothetical protein DRP47_10930 [candidate division Zixibacteria bacterium]